ncbi:MAG: hypothetical protein J6113_00290, partial [Lachnospiraceae bacterium]|nr:hypothetical protein [Lachnospiraceae bacterium]
MTSIVRRLVRRGLRKQIFSSFWSNFGVCALVIFLCLTVTELSANNGKPFDNANRKLYFHRISEFEKIKDDKVEVEVRIKEV